MPLSLVITYVGTFAIIVALIVVLIPQIINNLSNLVKEFPGYVNSAQEMLTVLTAQIAKMNLPFLQEVSVDDMVAGVTNFFMGSLMGIVISIYFLVFKEQLCRQVKKLAVAFIPIKYLPKVYEIVDITDTKCGRFLVGDILDAALLGVIFFVVLTVFDPWLAVWFLVIVFVIQQIDGNILKPKIIGNQVGLSSFWVLFSVIVGGALFGILGFILGTPIYAVFYSLIAKKARIKIEEKGKIAQEALDFKVLNYAEIAEEQRKIRAEKEQEQKRRLQKLLHLDFDEDDDDDDDDDGEKGASADEKAENFAETLNKH